MRSALASILVCLTFTLPIFSLCLPTSIDHEPKCYSVEPTATHFCTAEEADKKRGFGEDVTILQCPRHATSMPGITTNPSEEDLEEKNLVHG